MSNGAGSCFYLVPAICKFSSDILVYAVTEGQARQYSQRFLAVGIRIERALVVPCAETGSRNCVGRHHIKLDVVKKTVQSGLVLEVAACNTDGDNAFTVPEHYCWCQRDARPFAGLDTVRMSRRSVETAKSVTVCHTQALADGVGPITAGRGRYEVTPAVGSNTGGSAARARPIGAAAFEGLHFNRVTRAHLG